MAKPLFQDIVPPEKKSIKKIPIPERARDHRETIEESRPPQRTRPIPPVASERPISRQAPRVVAPEPEVAEPVPRAPRTRKAKRTKLPIILTVLALVIIGGLAFTLLPKATNATITLTPRGQTVSVDATFSANRDPNTGFPYQVESYEKDGKLTVAATGDEYAETKASGVIRIFNNYSTAPQKLVANTRFQTPAGLIFRIDQAVVIPGKVGSTPGSVDASVTADKVGADYNVGLSDFTIPGFKGDPRATTVFARSKDAIGGGFAGNRKKVDQTQVTAARQKIRDELQLSLIKQMQQNIPENFVFLPSAYFVEYQSLPDTEISGGIQLTERATFHGIIFKRSDLAKSIADKVQDSASGNNDLFGISNLVFTAKVSTSTNQWESDPLTFRLNGTTTLISAIDTDKLKSELAGKPRKSLSAVLTSYPAVAKAQVIMRPFWKQSFPSDPTEISVDIAKEPLSQ